MLLGCYADGVCPDHTNKIKITLTIAHECVVNIVYGLATKRRQLTFLVHRTDGFGYPTTLHMSCTGSSCFTTNFFVLAVKGLAPSAL